MVSIRRHPETGNPSATWRLVAGIDEEQLIETLSGLIDHQAKPSRIEVYLLAIPSSTRKVHNCPGRESATTSVSISRDLKH